jgi:hypothetical protein
MEKNGGPTAADPMKRKGLGRSTDRRPKASATAGNREARLTQGTLLPETQYTVGDESQRSVPSDGHSHRLSLGRLIEENCRLAI